MKKLSAKSSKSVVLFLIFVLFSFYATGNAVKNLQKSEIKKKIRAVYANYSNALLKTVAQMGGNTGCYYMIADDGTHDTTNCDEFYKTFANNLNVRRYCHGNALADSCLPAYTSYSTEKLCSGFTKDMMNKHDDVFVMADGSSLTVFNVKPDDRRPIFAVDINGAAPPNKAGEDLFSMTIMQKPNGAYFFHSNISHCLPVEKGGIEYLNDIDK